MPETHSAPSENEQPTFEAQLERLESIVEMLEDDEVSLDDALVAYEEGMALAGACLERLQAAEMRVQELALE